MIFRSMHHYQPVMLCRRKVRPFTPAPTRCPARGATSSAQSNFYVDFAAGSVVADLTIPPLGAAGSQTPETRFRPTGVISLNKKKPATYILTEGVVNSPDQPFIDTDGSLFGSRGRKSTGSLTGTICVLPCTVGGVK
jgi:hypothetical protein